jgi:hypothetical protein
MNKKQIIKLVKRAYPSFNSLIKYGSDHTCEGSPAFVDKYSNIWINKENFFKFSDLDQKIIILHEIGHILVKPRKIRNLSDEELFANNAATKRAMDKRWFSIAKGLKEMIRCWPTTFSWNEEKGSYRRYIIAGKKYNRNRHNEKKNRVRK